MTITPYLPGQDITGQRLQVPVVYQTTTTGGPTVGDNPVTLATLAVPNQGVPTVQMATAVWSGATDADGANDRWRFRITQGGASIITMLAEFPSAGTPGRIPFSAEGETQSIAAGISATYEVTIVRALAIGTGGSIGDAWPGILRVLVLPDPSSI